MEVYTDSGLFFKSLKKDYFLSYDRAEPVIDYRESNSFASINLRESTKREVYERSYSKIQEAAASAGGIVKIVTLICEGIVYFFRQILYKNFMIQFFKFNKKELNNINNKIRNTQSLIGNPQLKNNDSSSIRNNTYMKNNLKNSNLSNLNQNRVYSIDSTPKFRIGNKIPILPSNNNSNNNSHINNNTNNYILNNSNNNINNNSNNNVNIYKNYSKVSNPYRSPQRNDTNISVVSGLKVLINNKNMENKIITVKSSRNCFTIIFRKGCFKKMHYININYSKIAFLFDIVQFFKTKFEVKLIKNKLFNEGERIQLSHLFKFNYEFDADKEGYDIFYKKKNPNIYSARSSQIKLKN